MNSQFAEDVRLGLSSSPKYLSSKYFYNEKGDKLFQEIMHMPAYYLTRSEFEIFTQQKDKILALVSAELASNDSFHLIEFGAGDGLKTKILLKHFLESNAKFIYSPVDISGYVLSGLTESLEAEMPDLEVKPIEDDYFKALERVRESEGFKNNQRRVVMFLGSNLGNFPQAGAVQFLSAISNNLSTGDLLLIGLDLKKNPQVVLDAYNDAGGITKAFNLNLLERMNKELGANFQLNQFEHYPTYDPITGATKSYLISLKAQKVYIEAIDESFSFDWWEPIDMELSFKYSLEDIDSLANAAGFEVVENLFDCKHFFTDSIWQKK